MLYRGITQFLKKEFTYAKFALNHLSCIDHFITTHNIFDCILENAICYDVLNPSSHSLVYFCVAISNFKHVMDIKCDSSLIRNCNWSKATAEHIDQYQLSLNERLLLIETNTIMTNCRCSGRTRQPSKHTTSMQRFLRVVFPLVEKLLKKNVVTT